jgi:Spy/CpxP family protein refolding chaperone
MKPDWKQIVPALLIGCLLGLWTGTLLGHRRHAAPGAERTINKFSRDLGLDTAQRDSLKAIMESYRGKFDSLHADTTVRLSEIRAAMNEDIAKLLRPDQQQRFQDMQTRWDARHKNRAAQNW